MKTSLPRTARQRRVRAAITRGRSEARPQLVVFRSNTAIYAQITQAGRTLAAADDRGQKGTKTERAAFAGKTLAAAAKKAGVETVVFHRNGFAYHGRVKALADAARDAGLSF